MASSIQEPDLFNDVEIMEISDFNTENDENYVSVELLSENEDDEEDDVTLDTIPFCPPKDLLGENTHHETATDSEHAPLEAEQNRYAMASTPQHRFLSDHQYLVGSSMHHIVPTEPTEDQIAMRVPHSSERFSVSYDMDIRTQDLFNKESQHTGESGAPANGVDEEEMNNNIATVDSDFSQCKIEIEETQFHEDFHNLECVSHEEIMAEGATDESEDDMDYNAMDNAILDCIPRVARKEYEELKSLANDHSYTSYSEIFYPSTTIGDKNIETAELVALSHKLAQERDTKSAGAKQIILQIEQAVKSFRKRQQEQSVGLNGESHSASEEPRSDSESLSALLETNRSERLENDGIMPSSTGSVANENGNEDSGTDTDCNVQRRTGDRSSETDGAAELDRLLALGDCFAEKCEKWLSCESEKPRAEPAKYSRLLTIFDTLKRQFIRHGKATEKAEIAVQTISHRASSERDQRALNEECKKKILALGSDSSSQSDSDESSRTANSDSENADMMSDFVHRKRLLSKRNKSRLGSDSANENGRIASGRKIYTDSSSESDDDKKSAEKNGVDRIEADDNLLEDVLSGADDIMLDVHDILPVAEDVVQDYLEKEEVRNKKQAKENADESGPVKDVSEMTEAELREYNEAQEEREIDRLCNINYLSIGRSTSTPAVAAPSNSNASKAKDQKKKKVQDTIEDFLNDEDSNTTIPLAPSDRSDASDEEAVETEEQFLQKCNENMKYQLLNQLSSSSSSISSDDDGTKERSRDSDEGKDSKDDSDVSSDSICDSFLKRLERKAANKSKPNKEREILTNKLENGSSTPEHRPEEAVVDREEVKQSDSNDEGKASSESVDKDNVEGKKEPRTAAGRPDKVELADPKDRALFSRDIFKEDSNTLQSLSKPVTSSRSSKGPRRRRRKEGSLGSSALSSHSDTDGDNSSSDSDVELLNEASKSRKRTRVPSLSLEPFDYNDPLLSSKAPKKKTPSTNSTACGNGGTDGDVGVASDAGAGENGKAVQSVVAQSSFTKAPDTPAAISPVEAESSSSATTTTKNKSSSRDEQDCISLSSESEAETEVIAGELEDTSNKAPQENKRKIRAMLTNDELAEETKKAQKEEEGRVARLKKKNEMLKKFLHSFRPREGESEMVLDYDSARAEAICVHPDIVKLLKPHQIEGIKFMYDNTYGSVDALPKHPGSGCILAHCMGLGKTLQIIALLHTVMRYPQLMTRRILVICPKSTIMNWKEEIDRWQGTIKTGHQMHVYCFPDVCQQTDKLKVLKKWFTCAAPNCSVMLIGYEAFRTLINYERRKRLVELPRSSKLARIKEYLLNPGAELVICDEGHQIKNKRSAISEAVSKIKTKRRIMLTGTPIQNNLKEYYCMVNFIKPSFLGSDKEFSNLYANPIKNGQCKDSDERAIKIMKQRSYVLHNKLSKFVQRKEAAVLKDFLPEKFEYVLFVPLTPVQEKMYEVFLQMNEYTSSSDISGEPGRTKKFKLIADYTSLRKIWTHPKVLEKAWESANQEKNRRDAARKTATPDSYDESPDDHNDIASGQLSVTNDWWRRYLDVSDLESLVPSNKLWIMFEILKHSNDRGEKCLIFSAFVAVLNVVEHFMAKIHKQEEDRQQSDAYAYSMFKGPWEPQKDYYRLDGKTPKSDRHRMITSFNDPRNTRTKCFLISAKAGGQGINLTGANRVIILDTSWNPSNDQQNIFRIFRLGQKRKCYVYRLLAMGTMEEKVYSRSVTKQALSHRVVDEQQIDRHYSYGELAELYTLAKVSELERETPIVPADDILCLLLRLFPDKIFKYHLHESLLENKTDQDLSEEEKKEAWAAYEREIQTNENRSLMSAAWGSVSQAGLFNQPVGPYSRMMDFWGSLGFAGLGGPTLGTSGGEMYRSDFSYNRSLYHAYAQHQQQYSLLNDPTYSSLLSKTYGGYPLPGAGGLDFAGPSMLNGQPVPSGSLGSLGAAGKPYDPTAALANFFNMYPSKSATAGGSGGSSSSGLGMPNQSTLPPSSSSPLGVAPPPYNGMTSSAAATAHYNALKHMSGYNALSSALHSSNPQSSGLTISSVASLAPHLASTGSTSASGQSGVSSGGGIGQSNASMLSMLNEQAQLLQAAASPYGSPGVSSSPFSPRSVPLLPPTIDTQMRNFMGSSSKNTTQPPKTSSPKTLSTVPHSPQATSSSDSTATTSTSSSTARSTSGGSISTVTTSANKSSSSSSSNSSSSSIITPIITSVMSMAPHITSMNLDPPHRRLAEIVAQQAAGASKKSIDRNSKSPNTPVPSFPPSTTVSIGSTGGNRAATPTVVRSSSSPTIIPSDDDDEETVRNKQTPRQPRNVANGAGETTRDSETVRSSNTNSNSAGIVYGAGNSKTTSASASAPKPTATGNKDGLKSAKSLTNLTQTKPPVRKASSPSVGVKPAGVSISQAPPPMISSPEARPFQTFALSSSGHSSLATNPFSLGKNTLKPNRQSSPLASKFITPGSKTAQQQQQQQQITKPISSTPSRGLVNAAQPKPLSATPKGTSPSGTAALLKSLPDRPAVSAVSSQYTGQTVGSSAVTTIPSKNTAPISKPPSGSSVSNTRQPSTPPLAGGNVAKTLQKSATEGPARVTASTVASSVATSGALTGTKANVVINPASSARVATKPSTESRPITLSLTPLQTGGGAAVDTAAKVNKNVVPLLPKADAVQSNPSAVASVGQSNRSSPVGMRPSAVAAQKSAVSSPAKGASVPTFPPTVLSGPTGFNRLASPGGITSGTVKPAAHANLKPNPPIRVPTIVSASSASTTAVNRLTKGGSAVPTIPRRPIATTGGAPAPSAFASRPHVNLGATTMTVIPAQNITSKPPTTPLSNRVMITTNAAKPTLSYSIKNGNKPGGVVITKATASPTIRQILPAQGGGVPQHVVLKSATGNQQATTTKGSISTVNAPSSGGSTVRQAVPTLGLRAGNSTTSSTNTTLPVGQFQPGGTNNVFIRKRKSDPTLGSVKPISIDLAGPAKRPKVDEPSPSSTASQAATTFAVTNRLIGAGITVTPKESSITKDRVEIVEIE